MGFQEEAILRNKVLVNLYGRLPSYALFDDTFISQQCLQTRIEWFKTFNKGEYLAKRSHADRRRRRCDLYGAVSWNKRVPTRNV